MMHTLSSDLLLRQVKTTHFTRCRTGDTIFR